MTSRTLLPWLLAAFLAACGSPTPAGPAAPAPAVSSAPPAASVPDPPASAELPAPVAVASASASAAPAAPETPEVRRPMNVLLLVIDAMRSDMPWNGYTRPIAPNLTKLYERSVRFPRHYSISSFTSKSVPSILSGRYPSELHRSTPFFTVYGQNNEMMAEVLQRAGVRTLAGQAHAYLDRASGLTQGFDVWRLVPGITFDYNKDPYITSQKHTPLAIDILSDPKNVTPRFFAYFHYMDPHDVYQPHEESPKYGRKARDLYDEEMFYTDLWIQKLLDWVDTQSWAKETAIIVTADHGEAFGEHKIWRHAFELYDVLVHVPLFFVVPGAQPREVPAWRSQIDLVPTIYDLMGVQAPEGLPGKSLVPEILGKDEPARPIICDLPADTHNERRRAFIEDGWKLIAFGNDFRYEMYNLLEDPGETRNLFKKNKAKAEAMRARYKQVSATLRDVKARGGDPVKN